ncbi:MAG: hypothetical protein HY331_01965 [Chloroflexi bacterium]|nr:hypothetical protein [Chloroflexota bacterium]
MNVEPIARRIVAEIAAQAGEPLDQAAALNDLALELTRQIPTVLAAVHADGHAARLLNEIAEELVWEAGNQLDLAELRFDQIRRLGQRAPV